MDEEGPQPTSPECIRTLPRHVYNENLTLSNTLINKDCTVCKDDYKVGEKLIELPCKHTFHEDCILPWLNIHNSCPTCRHALPITE